MKQNAQGTAPEVSPLLLATFGHQVERLLAHHFHAVWLSKGQRPDPVLARGRPLVLYLNHPSWWDPLVCAQLARQMFSDRRHYAPIEIQALGKDRLFARLGFFAADTGTAGSARRFLSIAQAVLRDPGAALWLPAAGRLSDPRERPVRLQSALGHLASRLRQGVFLPVALEYPFWEDRVPEALVRFGEEVSVADAGLTGSDWTLVLEEKLAAAQQALAEEAIARDPVRFEPVLVGGAGAGGFQGAWRRLRARLKGERSRAAHGQEEI